MLKLFKQNMIGQLAVILAAMVVIWGRNFIAPVAMPEPMGFSPIYNVLYGWLAELPRLATAIALLLMIAEGLIFNEMIYRHAMISQNTLLPMLIYVLLMSQGEWSHTLTPVLLVNMMLLIAASQMIQTGQPMISVGNLSSAALCVGISSMIYLPCIVLLLPLMMLMPTFKMYRWNDWMGLMLGIIGPYLVLTMVLMLQNNVGGCYATIADTVKNQRFIIGGSWLQYVFGAAMLIFSILVVWKVMVGADSRITAYKNNMKVVGYPMIGGVVCMALNPILPLQIQWVAVGVTLAASLYLWEAKKKLWAYELMLWGLILITIFV